MSRPVALVRHGSHDELGRVLSGRTSDVGLSQAGRAEVAALGRRLAAGQAAAPAAARFAAIQTSPRRRTAETAAILAEALSLRVETVAALDEIDFGDWSGRRFADLDPLPAWRHWNAARGTAPTPGGETMAAAVARLCGHLDHLAAAGDAPVLLVSHSDMIRGLIAHLLGLPLDHVLRFEVDPASVSRVLAHGQGSGHVLTVNDRE